MVAIWIGSFCKKLRYFTDHNGPKEGPQENTKIQKWMLQTVSAEKVDEKKGVICLSFKFRSCVMDIKLSKKVYFVQFTAESSHYTLSENGMV